MNSIIKKIDLKDKKKAKIINRLLKQGIKEYHNNKLEQAVEKFYKILEMDPNNPDCLYYLGLYYSKKSRFEKSIELFEQLLSQEYNYLYVKHIYLTLGYCFTELGKNDKAIEYFNKALELDFNLVTAMSALGHLYFITGKTEKALIMLENAILLEPENPSVLNTYGYILADKEIDILKGIELCKKAIKINPKSGAYHDSLGWALYKNNQPGLALQSLKKAEKLLPNNKIIKSHIKIVQDVLF